MIVDKDDDDDYDEYHDVSNKNEYLAIDRIQDIVSLHTESIHSQFLKKLTFLNLDVDYEFYN